MVKGEPDVEMDVFKFKLGLSGCCPSGPLWLNLIVLG